MTFAWGYSGENPSMDAKSSCSFCQRIIALTARLTARPFPVYDQGGNKWIVRLSSCTITVPVVLEALQAQLIIDLRIPLGSTTSDLGMPDISVLLRREGGIVAHHHSSQPTQPEGNWADENLLEQAITAYAAYIEAFTLCEHPRFSLEEDSSGTS
jgi:hypothetical protein